MLSPPILDFEALLAQIPGDNPAGGSVPFAIREKLDEYRKEVDPDSFSKTDPTRPEAPIKADWPAISKLAQETLRETSKDMLVAARLTEALAKAHGAPGIRDGIQLFRMMIEQCWDRMNPVIETEDDLEVRAAAFNWLDDKDRGARFPSTMRMIPIIGREKDRYSWHQWKEMSNPKAAVTAADIEKAIQLSTREQCEQVFDDLSLAWQELQLLSKALNEKMGGAAPGLTSIRDALEDCRSLAHQILQKKGGPTAPAPAAAAASAAPANGAQSAAGPAAAAPAVIYEEKKMVTRADVYAKVSEAAAVLQQLEPHSPIPYLLNRAVELGNLPFPDLMKNLILNADVLKLMNRELGIKDTPDKK
jgi:type VI secretion system protein ImpA